MRALGSKDVMWVTKDLAKESHTSIINDLAKWVGVGREVIDVSDHSSDHRFYN